jgi:hypothetical protein
VIELGATLIACPGGTIEASGLNVSGLRYELTEACRDATSRGHIEVSGIAGRPAAPAEANKQPPKRPGADGQAGRSGQRGSDAPRRFTRCDPATWNCRTEER